jgi:hypothetical protein
MRYWRVDPVADYGCLNGVARHRINTNLVKDNWMTYFAQPAP